MFQVTNTPGAVKAPQIQRYRENFLKEPVHRVAMNALTRSNIMQVALDRRILNDFDFVFSNEIEIKGPPVDQERAGTCWLFADTNWLRTIAAKNLKCEAFDFSQNFHVFFDKLEKANLFLEKMIEYRDRDLLDRHLGYYLKNPVSDGGDWLYTVNCIAKYGLVPASLMPDTFNLKNTRFMNEHVAYKCRQGAHVIRELARKGRSVADMRKAKEELLGEIFNLLVMFLGLPPEKFTWAYREDAPEGKKGKKKSKKKPEKKYRRLTMTPRAFARKYIDIDPADYITLLNLPVEGYPLNEPYDVEHFQNTVGGSKTIFLNVDISVLVQATLKSVKAGDAVLYASNAGPGLEPKLGFYHEDLYDLEGLFNMKFPMTKGQRISYFQEQCNHLQLFIGVDIVGGKPVKWKVENSWGKQYGKKGLFMMSNNWFEEHIFTVLVHRRYVPKNVLNILKKKTRVLPLGGPFA